MSKILQCYLHQYDVYGTEETFIQNFLEYTEAYVSEFLENLEDMFLLFLYRCVMNKWPYARFHINHTPPGSCDVSIVNIVHDSPTFISEISDLEVFKPLYCLKNHEKYSLDATHRVKYFTGLIFLSDNSVLTVAKGLNSSLLIVTKTLQNL